MPVTESEMELTLAMRDEHHALTPRSQAYPVEAPSRLARRSPSAAAASRADSRCRVAHGASLVAGQPSAEERKVVTVVFADLVGFAARAESLDPEDVGAIYRPYYARLREELERYGGTVEKFIGDAVVAVFGAPVVQRGRCGCGRSRSSVISPDRAMKSSRIGRSVRRRS